jgi:hypothetical protein
MQFEQHGQSDAYSLLYMQLDHRLYATTIYEGLRYFLIISIYFLKEQ